MKPEVWQQVQDIFAATADLPEQEKQRTVNALCGDDQPLADSVFELLEEDARTHSLLDSDADQLLGRMAESALRSDHISSLIEGQIGPYRLLRVLGEGGMGVVYLAERMDIGGQVAIKLLRDPWLSPMRRERFTQEQQALVKLNHPAIARLYDASTMRDGTPWFVMEFADGPPITEYVRERKASTREDLLLFRRVCEAVQYAHSHAVIHRDLKPSNILVTRSGEVKLLDFGIAKQLDREVDRERTIAELRLLSPGYAAPEQHTGEVVGVFTDVYSLGVLLYELLTGQLPQGGLERLDKPPVKPSALARSTSRGIARGELSKREWTDLDVLCLTALQPDPERRYRSVDALIRDVNAYLDSRVLEARPNSFAYVAGKYIQRNRLPLTAVALILLLLVGGTIFFTLRLAHARDAALAEAARTRRIQRFMLDGLGNSDEEAAPSQDLKVITLLDHEAQQVDALQADPETQIELEQTLGSMYNRLGNYDKSEQFLTRALSTSKHAGNTQQARSIELLVQLGTLQGDRGNGADAQKDLQEAVHLASLAHLRDDDPTVVQAHISQGRVDVQTGEYQKAIEVLTHLAQLPSVQAKSGAYELRDICSTLAVAALATHDYPSAGTMSQRAIALDRELLGNSHVQTGIDLMNLASLQVTEGNLALGEQLYREGSGIMAAWYGPDHPDVATSRGLLAQTLIARGKDAEAEAILRQVLPIQEKAYGPNHPRVALTLLSLGDLAVRRGELQSAEASIARAVTLLKLSLGESDFHTAAAESTLGTVYLKEFRYSLAESTLRHSVQVISRLPPGNNLIGVARGRWGRALLALQRYPEAQQQLTSAAILLEAQHNPPPIEVKNVTNDLAVLNSRTTKRGTGPLP